MSTTNVETEVVQMRFDNKNFEKNVQQTMDSVDKLKKELNFDAESKSFQKLEENTKKIDFNPLTQGIEKVKASFSMLDTFSFTVYQRLSNRLIDLSEKIVKSASTEGIKSGFSEYELKMNSFKTIQASAGKEFSDAKINEYLEELNKYADKTIYLFSDMTNNIGKFTNAGVKLDVAVKAIKGISNEAAVSGANAAEASRAMYNFSQALSAGYVKLIDWKSIENANMATEEFKTQLLETAVSLNKVKKNADGTYKTLTKGTVLTATKNFNETLSEQWMTTEVLTKTLEKYADETTEIGKKAFEAAQQVNTFSKMIDTLKESVQSGWAQVWEILIGDLKTATVLWTGLSEAIGGVIDKFFTEKKAILQLWKEAGGLDRTIQALKDIFSGLGRVLDAIASAWHAVFPKKATDEKARGLMQLTIALENFAKKLQPGSLMLKKITSTFKGLFSVISIVKEAFVAFYNTFGKFVLRVLKDAVSALFDVSGGFGEMLYKVNKSVKENQTFYKTFKAIVDVLEWVYGGIKKVASVLWDFAKTVGSAFSDAGGFTAVKKWFTNMKEAITNFDIGAIASGIASIFKNLWKIIDRTIENTFDFYKPLKEKMVEFKDQLINSKFGQWVKSFYQSIVDGVQKIFDSFRGIKTDGIDDLNEETKGKLGIFEKIINFFKKVGDVIKNVAMTIWPFIKSVVSSLGTGIQMLWSGVTENIKNSDLGDAGGLMAGGGVLALGLAIRNFVKNLSPMFKMMGKLSDGSFLKNIFGILENASKLIKANIIKEIAVSLLILVGALFVLCTLPQDKVVAATASMGVLFQGLTSVFKSLDGGTSEGTAEGAKSEAGRLFGIAATLLAISLAMVVLTAALKRIGNMDVESLTIGTIVLGLLFKMVASTIEQILSIGQKTRGAKAGSVDIQAKGVASMIKQLGKSLIYIMGAVAILAWVTDKFGAGAALGAVVGIVAIMTVVAHLMETIMMYSTQQNSLQVKGTKALGVAATMFGIAFIIKEVGKALAIVIATIAVVAALLSHNMIDGGALFGSFMLFIGVLAAIIGSIKLIKNMADDLEFANIGKLTLLIGVITLFVDAMAILVAVMSLLPKSWAISGSSVILAIAASISLIMLALAAMLKNYEMSYVDVKGIATIMSSITLAILAVTAALAAISMAVGEETSTKAILIILGIAAAIAGIVLAIGKFNKVARGVKIFSNAMGALGIAAAGFAAAALLIIMTISKVSKMSDSEIGKIGTNMKKVATAILSAADQLIGILAGLIRITVETVITTAVTTIIGSAGRIIDGLIELCDVLIVKAPTLVEKLILVLTEVLSRFERRCGPLIAQVVSTVATIIEQVAQAILDNADKIINAIDKVITAISTLIVKSIAKIFGFDKFKGAVNTLIKIVKPVSAALIAMFAYAKIKKNAQVIITVLNTLKNRLKLFRAGLSSGGFANGWKEFLGINKLNEAWERVTLAHERGMASTATIFKNGAATILKAAGIGSAVGLALGSVVKAFIEAKTESMNVVDTWAAELSSKYADTEKKIYTAIKETGEKTKQYRDTMYGVDTRYDTTKQKLNKLFDMVDASTGRIKEGKEDEVTSLVEEINSELGTRLVLENRILSVMDEQGKKRKADLDTLLQINTAEELKAKIEESQARKEEITKKGGALDKARETLNEEETNLANEQIKRRNFTRDYYAFKREWAELEAMRKDNDADNYDEYKERLRQYQLRLTGFQQEYDVAFTGNNLGTTTNVDVFNTKLDNMQGAIDDLSSSANSARINLNMLVRWLDELQEAADALASGDPTRQQKASLRLSGYYNPELSIEQAEAQVDDYLSHLRDAINNPKQWTQSQIDSEYETLKIYYDALEKNAKEKEDLDALYKKYQEAYAAAADTIATDYGTKATAVGSKLEKGEQLLTKAIKNGTGLTDFTSQLNQEGITGDLQKQLTDRLSTTMSKAANSTEVQTAMSGAMNAAGLAGGEAYVSSLAEAILGPKTESIFNHIAENINGSMSDGFMGFLQGSLLPAIAGLTGQSNLLGGLFPVNFGGIQNGSGLPGVANAPAMSFATPLPYQDTLNNINTSLNKLTEKMVEQTTGITNEIRGLRSDVVDLGSRIDDMEVLLDGDALVGRLTPRINNALVTYSYRAGRGV